MAAPPPARTVEGRDPQKNVLILLEEKIGRTQNLKSGEHYNGQVGISLLGLYIGVKQ